MGKKATPPRGADVFYSRVQCEPRLGLIYIAAQSGEHTDSGWLSVEGAIKLYTKLGVALRLVRATAPATCLECARRAELD